MDVYEELKFLGKFKKKKIGRGGGQDGCERRIEFFLKILKIQFKKKNWVGGPGGGGGGGRVGGSGWM